MADVVVGDPRTVKDGPLYFLETDDAVDRRRENSNHLNPQLLNMLERVLRDVNPFAQGILKMIY